MRTYLGGYELTVLSLFSGAGGLDLGIIKAGNSVIWANEIDKNSVETYKKNISNYISCTDIKDVCIAHLPNTDVVVGGFPCQGFSLANLQRQVDDERNKLYKYFYKVIKKKQPKYFIAENVRGILSLDNGNVIKSIIKEFSEAGYYTNYQLCNMANYGVPQTRQRVIIIGQRKDLGPFIYFQFPKITHDTFGVLKKWVSIREAIDHFPDPDCENDIPNHIYSSYKVEYRNFTGHRQTNPDKPSPTILARGNGKGGVCAIPHYNGKRRLTIRESASVQTFPENFVFTGTMNSCYRQIGNAVPVKFAYLLGKELVKLEKKGI
jgi:DNA (cytosine-5)-methyltransferase 1